MAIFESDLFNGTGRSELEECKAKDSAHIFKGGKPGPHVARIQEALRKLGFTVTDPSQTFGQSTSDAVFKFKGPPRNILQPGQKIPDRFVGKRTITQLDEEVAKLEGKGKKTNPAAPGAPVAEEVSQRWSFTFFGNKGFTGKGLYNLTISSLEFVGQKDFIIDESFDGGTLNAGFKGDARGSFTTLVKVPLSRFSSAQCDLNLFKLPFSEFLQGQLKLQLIGSDLLNAILPILQLKDETFGTSLTTGTIFVRGQLIKR